MNFGEALDMLWAGHKVAREGWNGKDMFVFLVDGSNFTVNREPLATHFGYGYPISYMPHLDMKYADGRVGVWVPSQSDVLADDWGVVGEEEYEAPESEDFDFPDWMQNILDDIDDQIEASLGIPLAGNFATVIIINGMDDDEWDDGDFWGDRL